MGLSEVLGWYQGKANVQAVVFLRDGSSINGGLLCFDDHGVGLDLGFPIAQKEERLVPEASIAAIELFWLPAPGDNQIGSGAGGLHHHRAIRLRTDNWLIRELES